MAEQVLQHLAKLFPLVEALKRAVFRGEMCSKGIYRISVSFCGSPKIPFLSFSTRVSGYFTPNQMDKV